MKRDVIRRSIIVFVIAATVQGLGFPLISKVFGLGDRFQAPSWVVIILVSLLFVFADQAVNRDKQP
jgi:ABC-type multidrug transport system permease subunit